MELFHNCVILKEDSPAAHLSPQEDQPRTIKERLALQDLNVIKRVVGSSIVK